jgi:hypothetical protein
MKEKICVTTWIAILKTVLVWSSIFFGLIAAWLWYKSTLTILYTEEEAPRNKQPERTNYINYFATAEAQGTWNKRAAIVTAFSLFCQAVSLALQQI